MIQQQLSNAHHVIHHTPLPTPKPAAAVVQPVVEHLIGVSYMDATLISLLTLAIGFGLGWYIKGRGITGVENDLDNVKKDIFAIKQRLTPAPAAPVVQPAVVPPRSLA